MHFSKNSLHRKKFCVRDAKLHIISYTHNRVMRILIIFNKEIDLCRI